MFECLCVPGSTAGEREVPQVFLEPGVRPPLVLPALQVQAHEVAPLEGRAQQRHLAGRVLRLYISLTYVEMTVGSCQHESISDLKLNKIFALPVHCKSDIWYMVLYVRN